MTSIDEKKKNRQMHYPLDKIYYGRIDGVDCIICEKNINHKPKYIELITLPNYAFVDRVLTNNFKITKSLKEEIVNKHVDVCLISKNGREKQEVTLEEIINIIKLINLLEYKTYEKLDVVCRKVSSIICDLLGINVLSNPNSSLQFKDVDEIAVPYNKVKKLKELLFNYIKISLILDGSVTIKEDDYRITRALNGCRIKKSFVEPFTITVLQDGEVAIECENVINGFQKPLKKKHE